MENLKSQQNTKNLESDKSAALLSDAELYKFRKLSKDEQYKQQEDRLEKLENLQSDLRKAVGEAMKTGDVEQYKRLQTIFNEKAKELMQLQKNDEASKEKFQSQWAKEIYDKCFDKNGEYLNPTLTKEEIKFIYDFDFCLVDSAHQLAKLIIAHRDIKSDISFATGLKKEEISTTEQEASSGGIKIHYGNLTYNDVASTHTWDLPEKVCGSFYIGFIKDEQASAKDWVFPKDVSGSFDLKGLTTAKGLILPEHIGGRLWLNELTSAKDLNLPKDIDGPLVLNKIISAEGLILPEHIDGHLYLSNLKSLDGTKLPESVGGLSLDGITSVIGLILPEYINGSIELNGLTSADGLNFPNNINGGIYLGRLKSAEGLKLPKYIGRNLVLDVLTSAKDLKLPEHIGGSLFLSSLTSTNDLILSKHIGGDICFGNLISQGEIAKLKKLYPEYSDKFIIFE